MKMNLLPSKFYNSQYIPYNNFLNWQNQLSIKGKQLDYCILNNPSDIM